MTRAGRDPAVLQQGRLPRPVRPGRQGLDRPGRGSLADAVLAPGHRDGQPADPADRDRRRPRRLLLRGAAAHGAARCARRSAIPDDFDPVGVVTLGHPADGGAPPARRPGEAASRSADVVHRGGWGSAGHPASPSARAAGQRAATPASVSDPRTVPARNNLRAMTATVTAPSRSSQALIRIPTVSPPRPEPGRRRGLRRASWSSSARQFPLLHERLELTRVDTHGLLFRWAGRQTESARSC